MGNKQQNAIDNAMSDFELTRSIIFDCPAMRLPTSFTDRLCMVSQIVVLKGGSPEFAQFVVDACNEKTERDAAIDR